MLGYEFLDFLVENSYLPEVAKANYENPNIDTVIDNMYKTNLISEELLISYLNKWNKLPCELGSFENKEVVLNSDVVEKNKFKEFENYIITPYETQFLDGGSLSAGGIIKFVVPFKYYGTVTTDYIRKSLKVNFQISVWKIQIDYGILEVCCSMFYKYASKYVDANIESMSHLTPRQKVLKVFRDAVKSGTMDIVFNVTNGKLTILRKYMSEYHLCDDIKFSDAEISNLKNLLISNLGAVPAVEVNSHPNLDFKISNLNEDGKYEGRVNYMSTKTGYQFHIRIIKLEYNKMDFEDYYLAEPVKQDVLNALDETMGLILVTGPRGSGKQVFLYSCINEFVKKRPYSFIETLEDPVEARLEGNVAQVEVDIPNGYDFVYYLRGIKRHSTNLYMIGELRDRATVEAALTEAASAALIITTTHCPDCAGVLKKMSVELKEDDAMLVKLINEFKVVTNLTMAMKACPKCQREVSYEQLSISEKKFVDSWGYKGKIFKQSDTGCDFCKSANYKKVGKLQSNGNMYEPLIVVESLAFDNEVMDLINQYESITAKEKALRAYMIKNGRYKTQIALGLVNRGLLNLEECMKHFSPNVYTKMKN